MPHSSAQPAELVTRNTQVIPMPVRGQPLACRIRAKRPGDAAPSHSVAAAHCTVVKRDLVEAEGSKAESAGASLIPPARCSRSDRLLSSVSASIAHEDAPCIQRCVERVDVRVQSSMSLGGQGVAPQLGQSPWAHGLVRKVTERGSRPVSNY